MVNFKGRYEEHYEVTVRHFENGAVEAVSWTQNGKLHRIGGPTTSLYDTKGQLIMESWGKNGEFHRAPEDGPAFYQIDSKTRVVVYEAYFWEGKPHRIGGPAKISRSRNTGAVTVERFYENGVRRPRPKPIVPTSGFSPT